MDSTVIEANIHYPTDAALLSAQRLQSLVKEAPVTIRNCARSVKKKILAMGKVLRRRTGDAVAEVRRITEDVARMGAAQSRAVVEASKHDISIHDAAGARRVARVEQALQDVQTVIRQSRSATAGERITDRLVTVADPDARPIKKGKLGRPVQFGYTVQIVEAEAGFVTDYTVHRGNPNDVEALIPALDRHCTQFGRDPVIVATDRGYWSAANDQACRARRIRMVAIPKRGKKAAKRRTEERRPAFRRGQRGRAGGEATISRIKRQYGLRRSRYRGYDAVAMGIGLGIFTHNVRRWAQRQASSGC